VGEKNQISIPKRICFNSIYETPKTHLTTRLLIPNLKHSPTDTLFLFSLSLSLSLSTGTFWHYLQQSIKHWAKVTPSLVGRKADRVQLQDSRPKEGGKLAHTKKVGKIKPDNGGSQ
jgi:hypothetical protein